MFWMFESVVPVVNEDGESSNFDNDEGFSKVWCLSLMKMEKALALITMRDILSRQKKEKEERNEQ